jgi:hypothetical protein
LVAASTSDSRRAAAVINQPVGVMNTFLDECVIAAIVAFSYGVPSGVADTVAAAYYCAKKLRR